MISHNGIRQQNLDPNERQLVDHLYSQFQAVNPTRAEQILDLLLENLVLGLHLDGIFYRLTNSRTVCEFAVSELCNDKLLEPSQLLSDYESDLIVEILDSAAKLFHFPPFIDPPTWQRSPVLTWILSYSETPLSPAGFSFAHHNLIRKIRTALKNHPNNFSPVSTIRRMVDTPLRFAKMINWEELATLPVDYDLQKWQNLKTGFQPTPKEIVALLDFYLAKQNNLAPLAQSSLDTHHQSFLALFVLPRDWEDRDGLKLEMINSGDFELFEEEFENTPSARAAKKEDGVLISTALEYQSTEVSSPHIPSLESGQIKKTLPLWKIMYRSPLNRIQYLNPTGKSSGVLKYRDIVYSLQGVLSLVRRKKISHNDSFSAIFVLLAAIFNGWVDQLTDSLVSHEQPDLENLPKLWFKPGSNLVYIQPKVTIGRPDAITPKRVPIAEFQANMDKYAKLYVPSQIFYPIALHPILSSLLDLIFLERPIDRPLFTKDEIKLACDNLTHGLRLYLPDSQPINKGQLSTTFYGLSYDMGLDPVSRYAISGRFNSVYRMHLNYALASVEKANQRIWDHSNRILDKVMQTHEALRQKRHWDPLKLTLPGAKMAFTGIPNQLRSRLTGYTGSWSVPRTELVLPIIRFLKNQSTRTDLPLHTLANWKTLRLATEAAILMIMRDFDVNGLSLPYPAYHFDQFVQETKHKYSLERISVISRIIPPTLRLRWFECQDLWLRGYTTGPLISNFSEDMHRSVFDFQTETNKLFQLLFNMEEGYRAYAYRHLGVVLHLAFGFSTDYVMFKCNHYGTGHWSYDPIRNVDLSDYVEQDAVVTEKIAHFLGITED